MKIARLDLDDSTREEQLKKITEEYKEVVEAFNGENFSIEEDLVEELWDLIQACFGLLFKILPTLKLFRSSYNIHRAKMSSRQREGRIKITEWVEIISDWTKL